MKDREEGVNEQKEYTCICFGRDVPVDSPARSNAAVGAGDAQVWNEGQIPANWVRSGRGCMSGVG